MRLIQKNVLLKLKHKNKGNTRLADEIEKLIATIESKNWNTKADVLKHRPDADLVHSDGFYFFDLHAHRTMIMIEFCDEGEATVVWAGDHDKYERIFKNNKDAINKYLSNRDWI